MKVPEWIWNIVVAALVVIILMSSIWLYAEYKGAKEFCKNENGVYSLSFFKNTHFCNGKPIYKMTYGWDYERNYTIDLSNLLK